jgi:hypothetical protein
MLVGFRIVEFIVAVSHFAGARGFLRPLDFRQKRLPRQSSVSFRH